MASYLKTNAAVTICVGPFLDNTDGVTPETGLTVSNCRITAIAETDDNSAPTIILDNVAGNDATNTLAHITNDDAGYYSLRLTAANLNRVGRFKVSINDAANHCPVFHEFVILPANIYDSTVLGTDLFDVSMTQIDGQATNGNNATLNLKMLNIINNAGTALNARSTGGNGSGAYFGGNGSGYGVDILGGSDGVGLEIDAAANE